MNDFEFNIVQEKPVEQFRQEIIADIFRMIEEETRRAISFVEKADYVRSKFCECKIEGLHKALGIILEASTVDVKEVNRHGETK